MEGVDSLERDATFSWSRALTYPPRCNLKHHREVTVAEWRPSWIGLRDVFDSKVARILLRMST